VTVTNAGNAPVNISGIVIAGDFVQNNTCGSTLGALKTCAINVAFVPTGPGQVTGTMTITDNATNNPQVINLSGKGNNGNKH